MNDDHRLWPELPPAGLFGWRTLREFIALHVEVLIIVPVKLALFGVLMAYCWLRTRRYRDGREFWS